ncbi:hypothetical protein NXV12_31145 [Bacteroides thetaiotaomicron]|nr:hypothetical protein [Bacteroides thetaiotaomicron]
MEKPVANYTTITQESKYMDKAKQVIQLCRYKRSFAYEMVFYVTKAAVWTKLFLSLFIFHMQ